MHASFVHSYLKDGRAFVLASEWTKPVPDKLYVDGAIDLVVDGKRLLSFEDWDLVDQLWAYLIDGLLSVFHTSKPFQSCFPDQPLELHISRAAADRVVFSVGNHSENVNAKELLLLVGHGGKEFIKDMNRIIPSLSKSWNDYLHKCDELVEIAYTINSR